MSARLSELRSIPIDQLLPKAIERLRYATLDELAALLGPGGGKAGGGAIDALAKAVVASQTEGSKLNAAERAVVLHALHTCDGNVSAAARLLGVDRKALERRVRRIRRKEKK
jgi:transcriptional regulator of acetoin/glycerol metabolism